MALIGKIREKTRLLIVVVSLGLVFFIARELFGLNPLTSNKSPIIGKVAGKEITLREFQDRLDELQHNFLASYGKSPDEEENAFLREQAWKQLTNEFIYDKISKTLGITVSPDELVDMVQGTHIHPDLKTAFTNPETKEFNKKELLAYLQNLAQLPTNYQQGWYRLEKTLSVARCHNKFEQLMRQSVFVNSLEAQHQFNIGNTTLDLKYIYIPYSSVKDEEVDITDAMLKEYLAKHASDYQVEESKSIHYVTFPVIASKNDKAAFEEELKILKENFASTQEDSSFASIHTDADPTLVHVQYTEKDLPAPLLEYKTALRKGMVVGPLAIGESYKLYKVSNLFEGNPKRYEMVVIEKTLTPSDETKEKVFRKADDFTNQVTNEAQFKAQATQQSLHIYKAKVSKNDTKINSLSNVREIVRWLHNKAKVGQVSSVFELGNSYVVALVTSHTKAGMSSLEEVKDEIRQKVINEHKAKIIEKKIQPIANLLLDSLASQYGNEAKTFTASQVKFNANTLQGIGQATKTISQAFGLQPGNRSKIIDELSGIVLLDVLQQHTSKLPDSWEANKAGQAMMEQYKQANQLSKALGELANKQDYRYKYY
jgi:peptidyl-prolyl cis-trans isomerase D